MNPKRYFFRSYWREHQRNKDRCDRSVVSVGRQSMNQNEENHRFQVWFPFSFFVAIHP